MLTLGDMLEPWGNPWGTFSPESGKGGRWIPANRSEKEGGLLIIWIYIAIAGFAWLYGCALSCLIKSWECK